MSSQDYTLFLKIDTSKLNEQMSKFGQMFSHAQSRASAISGGSSSASDIFSKLVKNTLPLIGIGFGVSAMARMMEKASPILEGTFKLMQQSVMLILRPIGDFIGMALKPLTTYLLLYFVMPFYKYIHPLAVKYGQKLGQYIDTMAQPLIKFLTDPKNFFADILAGIGASVALAFASEAIWSKITGYIQKYLGNLGGGSMGKSGGSNCIELCDKNPLRVIPQNPQGQSTGIGSKLTGGLTIPAGAIGTGLIAGEILNRQTSLSNVPSGNGNQFSTIISQLNVLNRSVIDEGNKESVLLSSGFGLIGTGITSGFTSLQTTLNSMQVILAVISNNIASMKDMLSSGININNLPSGGNGNVAPLSGWQGPQLPWWLGGPKSVTSSKAAGIAAVTPAQ